VRDRQLTAWAMPLCPPQIPHGPTGDRTRASAVRGRQTNRLSHGTAINVYTASNMFRIKLYLRQFVPNFFGILKCT
jgi:hypothetical protein